MRVTWQPIGSGLAATLTEPEEFNSFWVRVPIEAAVADLGLVPWEGSDQEEVGVPADLVRGLAGAMAIPASWNSSFDRMLRAVTRFGWYDERTGLIRAHVERG